MASPERAWEDNLIGSNSGNLIFSHATYKLLSTPRTEIVPSPLREDADDAARINAEYDAVVIPLANAFRPSFRHTLRSLTRLIERLQIPVIVLGVGAQATIAGDTARINPMADIVRRFARAVLDRSASIGVRGEFTAEYLKGLGFKDVEVIGCPSMFLHGPVLSVEKRIAALDTDSNIAINISPYVKRVGKTVMFNYRKYPNLVYIAQDRATLELLLWGKAAEGSEKIPVRPSHPLYRENRIRYFLDPSPWLSFLAERDFSFGTRIHGNIASLLAGTPAYVLAHDSRTLELARYFEIPHRKVTNPTPAVDAADLYEEADYSGLNKGHASRFHTMAEFLRKHELEHTFGEGGDNGAAFERRVQQVTFPPPVETLAGADLDELTRRMEWLTKRNMTLKRQVDELQAQLDAAATGSRPFQRFLGRLRP